MLYVGIDPGLDGAIVALDELGDVAWAYVMPTVKAAQNGRRAIVMPDVLRILHSVAGGVVALEEPGTRPHESASSSQTTGRNHGRIEGALWALGIRFDLVRPQRWQKALGLGGDGDPKQRAIAWCDRMLPDLDLRATPRCRVPHSGLADAGCLAWYARRVLAGVTR